VNVGGNNVMRIAALKACFDATMTCHGFEQLRATTPISASRACALQRNEGEGEGGRGEQQGERKRRDAAVSRGAK
jgi:hypothetical protein